MGRKAEEQRAVRWINSRFAEGLSFEIPSARLRSLFAIPPGHPHLSSRCLSFSRWAGSFPDPPYRQRGSCESITAEIATRSAKYHEKARPDANEPFGNRASDRSAAN